MSDVLTCKMLKSARTKYLLIWYGKIVKRQKKFVIGCFDKKLIILLKCGELGNTVVILATETCSIRMVKVLKAIS